jgi:hypothetical protein
MDVIIRQIHHGRVVLASATPRIEARRLDTIRFLGQ